MPRYFRNGRGIIYYMILFDVHLGIHDYRHVKFKRNGNWPEHVMTVKLSAKATLFVTLSVSPRAQLSLLNRYPVF